VNWNVTNTFAGACLCLVGLAACAPPPPPEEPEVDDSVVIEVGKPSHVVSLPEPDPAPSPKVAFGQPSHLVEPPPGAEDVDGITSYVIRPGDGARSPALKDRVEVHYVGWKTTGEQIDSSLERGKPASLPVKGVIEGWQRGLRQMVAGERRRLWIPAALAYGQGRSTSDMRPSGDLVFDVELISIIEMPSPPPVPAHLKRPPPGAKKTPSGLAYRVLQRGQGTRHPRPTDRVEVHYTGWDTTGKMFDSSITRGRSAVFPLNAVIKGWTEGLQLMAEGDRFRFWMPASLAYGTTPKRPGAPAGDLVFDVELIAIR
jgi:peptidylprolyl isomerase